MSSDFKRCLALHTWIPLMTIDFLSLLLNAYVVLLEKGALKWSDQALNAFNLNISELNLHEQADQSMI